MREKPQMASMNAIHFTKKDIFSVIIPVEMNHPRYYSAWSCFLCGSYLTEGKKPKQQQQTHTQKAQNKEKNPTKTWRILRHSLLPLLALSRRPNNRVGKNVPLCLMKSPSLPATV